MFPSKIRPTISASRLITGLPELPPMMSFVDTPFSGVARSIVPFASIHRWCIRHGSLPPNAAHRSYSP